MEKLKVKDRKIDFLLFIVLTPERGVLKCLRLWVTAYDYFSL